MIELYLQSGSDYTIRNAKDEIVSLERARELLESGKVGGCNLAFHRLVRLNWDIEAVKRHYANGGR